MHLRSLCAALVGPLLLVPALSHAGGADARNAMRRFAEHQAGDRAGATVLVGRVALAAGQHELPASLDIGASGCKWKLDLPEGSTTALLAGGKLSEDGPMVPPLAALAALTCPWLSIRGMAPAEAELAIGKQLAQLGAAASTTSLARADRRVAVVFGARSGDRERPQVWFDKETGRPIRVVGKHVGQVWEARLIDPASIATGRRAPRVVEIWRGSERKLLVRLMTPQAEAVRDGTPVSQDDADDPD